MNIEVINQAIRFMCSEVDGAESSRSWSQLSEEELFFEVAVCIFGSQMVFEMAVAIAESLRESGYLTPSCSFSGGDYECRVSEALSQPLFVVGSSGEGRWVRPRFKNRLTALLSATVKNIYGQGRSIGGLLHESQDPKKIRESLVEHVSGFGPKQASLFLRRINFCSDLAVLDVHVLDYLKLTRRIEASSAKLGRLSCYEKAEAAFREVADEFGYSMGCVDLATWITMRVAKRELRA